MPFTYSGSGGYTNSGSGGSFGWQVGRRDRDPNRRPTGDNTGYLANAMNIQGFLNNERGGFRDALSRYGGQINALGQNTMGTLLGMPSAGQSAGQMFGWMDKSGWTPFARRIHGPGADKAYTQRMLDNLLGSDNAAYAQTLQANPKTGYTPESGMILENIMRNRNLGQQYQQVADRGILSEEELGRISNMLEGSGQKATSAYRQAAARNRNQMARGANTRQPMAARARDNMLAQSLDSEAQLGAQFAGANQGRMGDLLTQSLMGGRQMGLAGVGQTNAVQDNFLARRGWDPSFENKFGESSARRSASQVPMAVMQGQMGLMDADLRERGNYMGNLMGNQSNALAQYLSAFYNNQLADNALKRQGAMGQFGNMLNMGLGIGSMFGNPLAALGSRPRNGVGGNAAQIFGGF